MIDFLINNVHWLWFVVVVVFTLIELFTFGLTTIWFAIVGVVMIFLSFLPIPLAWQVLIFLVLSTLLLIFTRPIAIKKLKVGKARTNADSIIGKTAIVVKEISKFDKGEVKINGVIWSAKSMDDSEIKEGCECVIEKIEGVTLFVSVLDKTDSSAE